MFCEESDARIASHPERDPVFSESDEAPLLSLRRELLREGCLPSVTFSVTGADMDVGPVAVMSAGSVWGERRERALLADFFWPQNFLS